MATNLKNVYTSTLSDFLAARAFAGGSLSPDDEDSYQRLLEELWLNLSPEDKSDLAWASVVSTAALVV